MSAPFTEAEILKAIGIKFKQREDELLAAIGKAIARTVEGELRIIRAELAQERSAIATALAEAKAELAADRLTLRDMLAEAKPAARLLKAG